MFGIGFGSLSVIDIATAQKAWKEQEKREASCSSHDWELVRGMISRDWVWRCHKCGKCDSGIERPPAV